MPTRVHIEDRFNLVSNVDLNLSTSFVWKESLDNSLPTYHVIHDMEDDELFPESVHVGIDHMYLRVEELEQFLSTDTKPKPSEEAAMSGFGGTTRVRHWTQPPKVAFLVSGRPRFYRYCIHTFKEMVYDTLSMPGDIFVSFAPNHRFLSNPELCKDIPKEYQEKVAYVDDVCSDEQFLRSIFGEHLRFFGYDDETKIQRDMGDENEIGKLLFNKDQYVRVKNIATIFKNMCSLNDYDIVVRHRFDQLWWQNKVCIEQLGTLHHNTLGINIPPSDIPGQYGCTDFIFLGRPNLITHIMVDIFEYMKSHHSPERIFWNYICDKSIPTEWKATELCPRSMDPSIDYMTGYLILLR